MWLGWLMVGMAVGGLLLRPILRGQLPAGRVPALGLGMLLLHLLTSLPAVGLLVGLLIATVGLGTSILLLVQATSRQPAKVPAE
jgi:hypothetical protein